METEFSTEKLSKIQERTARAMEENPALTYYALQYRLCEVGQNRIEPYELRRALRELSNNRRPRRGRVEPGPSEPRDGLFVSAECPTNQEPSLVEPVVRVAAQLAEIHWEPALDAFVEILSGATPLEATTDLRAVERSVVDDISITAIDRTLVSVPSTGKKALVWVSQDTDWIYPDDARLWEFIVEAAQIGLPLVVIARKIAISTFVLFKALGVRGLQYYSTLINSEQFEIAAPLIRSLHWAPPRAVTDLGEHPITNHVLAAVTSIGGTAWSDDALRAVSDAEGTQLTATAENSAEKLLLWTQRTHLVLPPGWVRAVESWVAWQAYSIPPKRARLSGQSDSHANPNLDTHGPPPTRGVKQATLSKEPSGASLTTGDGNRRTGFGRRTQVIPVGIRIR